MEKARKFNFRRVLTRVIVAFFINMMVCTGSRRENENKSSRNYEQKMCAHEMEGNEENEQKKKNIYMTERLFTFVYRKR